VESLLQLAVVITEALYSSLFVTALGDVFGMYLLYEMDNHKQMQAKNQNE